MEVRRIFSQKPKKLAKSFPVCTSGELEETAFGQTFPANVAGKPTTKTGFFCFTVRYPCFPTSDSVSTQPGSQSGCGFQYTFCKLPPLSSACASLSANLCIPFRPNTISWNGFPPRDSFNQCTIRKKSDSVPLRLFSSPLLPLLAHTGIVCSLLSLVHKAPVTFLLQCFCSVWVRHDGVSSAI